MILYRGFELLLLDPDVALGDCSAAVLQELLDQGHVTAVLYRFWEKHHFSAAVSCLTVILYQSIIVSVGKNPLIIGLYGLYRAASEVKQII